MRTGFATMGMLDGTQEYRRVRDGQIFVVGDPSQLPCDTKGPCTYESLPAEYGEPPVTVYPRGNFPVELSGADAAPLSTSAVDFRAMLLEAVALSFIGGGAVAVGYGLGKPQPWVALLGALAIAAGIGVKVSNMTASK